MMEEPYNTPRHLNELHAKLLAQIMKARRRAAIQYDRNVTNMGLQPGERVMVWAPDLVRKEGNKVVPPCSAPYVVDRELSRVRYILR